MLQQIVRLVAPKVFAALLLGTVCVVHEVMVKTSMRLGV